MAPGTQEEIAMFNQGVRRAVVLLAAAVAVSLGGCIDLDLNIPLPLEVDEQWAVMPDGSGKMTMTVVMVYDDPEANTKEKIAEEFAPKPGDDPALEEIFGGVVGYEEKRRIPHDGAVIETCTVYFDDVSQFQYAVAGEPGILRYEKLSAGFALESKAAEASDVWELFADWEPEADAFANWRKLAETQVKGEDPDGSKRAAKALAERVLKGPRLAQTYTLPGDIKEANGSRSIKGRSASFVLARKDLKGLDDADAATKVKQSLGDRRIVCGPSKLSEKEVAAFRRELEEAKAAYRKRSEE
jgi:hypothetical protein